MKKILVSEEEFKRIISPLLNRASFLNIKYNDMVNLFHVIEVKEDNRTKFIKEMAAVFNKHNARLRFQHLSKELVIYGDGFLIDSITELINEIDTIIITNKAVFSDKPITECGK